MTMHSLYLAHPNGFDNFGRWCDHHKAMQAKHPLDCAEFGVEWLRRWEMVGRLLLTPANLREYAGGCSFFGPPLPFNTVHEALADMRMRVKAPNSQRMQVALLDGTIVREWPAKDDYDDIF